MWKNLFDQTQNDQNLPNIKEASLKLEKQMQKKAWPKGLDTINKLDKYHKIQINKLTPFLDKDDGLLKVGDA